MQLFNGDCLEIMKDIPDKHIDMIFSDLPYGTTKNKWDTVIDLPALWKQYERVIKDNGCIALWSQSPFDKILACSNLNMYRYEWIIEKTTGTGFLNAKKMPLKVHENILIFYKKLPTYNPQKTTGHKRKVSKAEHKINCVKTTNYGDHNLTSYDSTERYPRDVIKFKTDKQTSTHHPTQKPLESCEYIVKTYTNENDIILDNTMGSGTTGVACINTNRKFIGIELDQGYFNIAKERIETQISRKEIL